MSLKKSATRRLSLLAGSSLGAAMLSAAASLAPTMAYAYDECTPTAATGTLTDGANGVSDPTLNGAAADTFTCAVTPYNGGITYTSAGDLNFIKAGNIAITVAGTGIDLTATGADSITWNITGTTTTGGAVTGGAGLVGPLFDITTQSGSININNKNISAVQAGTTHGIRATSTGGGDITLTKLAQGTNNNVAGGVAAVEAVTNGGDIVITDGGVQGYQRGVLARTEGAGSVTVTTSGTTASATDGIAIDLTAGTGGIVLTTNSAVTAGSGLAVRAVTTGNAVFTHTNSVLSGRLDFSGVAGSTTFNVPSSGGGGAWIASGTSVFGGGADTLNLTGGGGNRLVDGATINLGGGNDAFNTFGSYAAGAGTIEFGTGDDSLTSSSFGGFTATGTVLNFGAGADTVTVVGTFTANGAAFNFGADNDTLNANGSLVVQGTTFDFGAGTDTVNLTERMTVNGVIPIVGVEAFNLTGELYLGGQGAAASDMLPGDVLTMSSGTFTGSGGGRVIMDVSFAGGGQTDCSTAAVADCLVFTGAATAGTTLLTLINADGSSVAGSSSRTVLVVGSSGADDFVLDPDSDGYVTTSQGAALRKRLFDFYLLYDDAGQQHVLTGVPRVEAFQISTSTAAAQDIWRSTTGSWFDRQADLRATPGGLEPSRGLWGRAGVSLVERDVVVPLEVLGASFDTDASYSQRTSHVVFGADVLGAATQGSAWVIGASAGLVRSDVEYDGSSSEVAYAGFTGGLYAGWIAGPFFLDATANANVIDVNTDMPTLNLDTEVQLAQTITSLGGQLQAGWRFAIGEGLFAEPLASISYVRTELDGIEVPGQAGVISFEEATSLRAGAGLRLGMDSELMGQVAAFSLTGRYWNELESENGTALAGNIPTLLVDDYSGNFGEVIGSVNLFTGDGGVSGFVNLGGKFADGYQSIDGSIGVRVRW